MGQVIQDLVRNCFTADGVQTYAKYAHEVVDESGCRFICEPWTADKWLNAQVRPSNLHGALLASADRTHALALCCVWWATPVVVLPLEAARGNLSAS